MKSARIKEAVIAVTYRCNSHCRMCNIWQTEDHAGEFKPEDLRCLPGNLEDINLTGGEPFLRNDLEKIVKILTEHCPRARLIISTNGFATRLIVDLMSRILKINPRTAVVVSLDGIGKKHEEIRGVAGGYEQALKTFKELKKMGVNVKLAFTLGDYNPEELRKVYELARGLKTEFSFAVTHSSRNFFNKENKTENKEEMIKEIDWLIKEELRGWKMKNWARAFFAFGAREFLRTGKRILPDYSGELNIFVDPKGDIYPNDVSEIKIGKLSSDLAAAGLLQLSPPRNGKNEDNQSWMICTARPAIKKRWFRVGWWILRNKFLL